MLEDLAKSGKVEAGSVVSVAKTGIGLAARKDAAPLDIGTAEALKRTLLAAKSVAHSKEGQSGIAAVKVMERLGIAEEMRPRIVLETRPGGAVTAVVEGKAELAFALVSEIVPVPEVKFVGPVPGDLQSYTVFAAGVSSSTKDVPAAKSFVEYLRGAGARSTLSAKGMEGM